MTSLRIYPVAVVYGRAVQDYLWKVQTHSCWKIKFKDSS